MPMGGMPGAPPGAPAPFGFRPPGNLPRSNCSLQPADAVEIIFEERSRLQFPRKWSVNARLWTCILRFRWDANATRPATAGGRSSAVPPSGHAASWCQAHDAARPRCVTIDSCILH